MNAITSSKSQMACASEQRFICYLDVDQSQSKADISFEIFR
jgi:hypothetical protein